MKKLKKLAKKRQSRGESSSSSSMRRLATTNAAVAAAAANAAAAVAAAAAAASNRRTGASSSKRRTAAAATPPAEAPRPEPKPHKGTMEIVTDSHGLAKVLLTGPRRSSAEILLYGAQVVSWTNKLGEELLFMSSKAVYKPPKPVRGGISICFPEFLHTGMIERHGFARSRHWRVEENAPPVANAAACSSMVNLILDEQDRWTWQHKYEFRHRVALGYEGELRLTSRIRNLRTDRKPFSFTFAYQPYMLVSDVGEVRVEGLETLNYLDHLQDKKLITEQADCITFEEEVDKVYILTPTKIAIIDHERKKTIELRKDGLLDAILWNPWDKKSKSIADLGNQDYKKMVCVGAAAIENGITLRPGQEWKGRMELTFVPSSYNSGPLDPNLTQ